ncbi:MAG: hypothetical protein ACP5QT_03600 [Brevinematia bacterium]
MIKFKYLGVLLGVLLIMLLFFSCGSEPSSASSSASSTSTGTSLNLKNYIGSASIGDIVSYGIDHEGKQLMYSNLTRGYFWSSTYSEESDGSCKFTVPVVDEEAFFIEIPDKMLVVNFYIRENNTNIPAFAVLVPQKINSADDLTNLNGFYAILEAFRLVTNDYGNGLYEVNAGAVEISNTNWSHYKGENSGLSNDDHGTIYFSNEVKLAYAVNPTGEFSIPMFIGDTTLAADMGIGKGFQVGLKLRTTPVTPSELAGDYIIMFYAQRREPNSTNWTSELTKGIVTLSNNGSYIDVWFYGTNVATMQVHSFPVQNKGINVYTLWNTNGEGGGVILSEDLSCGFIFEREGWIYNTNDFFFAQFGFVKKK